MNVNVNPNNNMDIKNISSQDAIAYIKGLGQAIRCNQVTYREAEIMAQPYLEVMNAKSREIAKKYGKKPTIFTWKTVYK